MNKLKVLFLGLVVLTGCSEGETTYHVDPNDVGVLYEDTLLGMSFQPPMDFQEADPGFLQNVRRQMLKSPGAGERFFIIPTMVFAVPKTDARCFVSEFPNIGAARFDDEWKNAYLVEAKEKAAGLAVDSQDILIGEIPMLAIEIESPSSVNRRYVFQATDGRFLQIDYIVPSGESDTILPRTYSSIGSLRLD